MWKKLLLRLYTNLVALQRMRRRFYAISEKHRRVALTPPPDRRGLRMHSIIASYSVISHSGPAHVVCQLTGNSRVPLSAALVRLPLSCAPLIPPPPLSCAPLIPPPLRPQGESRAAPPHRMTSLVSASGGTAALCHSRGRRTALPAATSGRLGSGAAQTGCVAPPPPSTPDCPPAPTGPCG